MIKKSIMYYVLCIKRFWLLFLPIILAAYFLIQTAPAYAQESTSSSSTSKESMPTFEVFQALPATVSPTSPLYTDLLVHNMFHTFSCLAVGQSVIGQQCLTYQMQRNAQGVVSGVPVLSSVDTSGGVLGTTGSLIGALYLNPPIKTSDYIASIGRDFGIIKEANAQVVGSGQAVLSPIFSLWQVSRNISYVLMIIIFLVIGLMVIFRTKINPQTVITAQAALPGLVLGLILITFSYFLAGLISDTAFIGTNLVGYYFSAAQRPDKTPQNLVDDIKNKNILSIFTPFTRTVNSGEIERALSSIWDDLHDPASGSNPFDLDPQKVLVILTGFMVSQLFSPFGNLLGGWSQIAVALFSAGGAITAPVQIASFALGFIAIAILIYAMFMLLLRLINAFLTIIFLTITAPFQFLFASLPGRQEIATNWVLNMLGNILIFPAVLAVLYFVAYLLGPTNSLNSNCSKPCTFIISQANSAPNNIAPLVNAAEGDSVQQTSRIVGSKGFPLFGGFNLGFIQLILAFGALVALPKIPDIIVSTVGKAGQAGQLLGQEIGSSVGQGRQYAGQVQQGIGGIGQQLGRVTDEPAYVWDPKAKRYTPNPVQSRGGLITRVSGGLQNFHPPWKKSQV